ncbi:non-ribosomal peptide synthetase [Spirosoma radiotolerans]|uniref:Amino acid adenylation protein n=1 Tax=Spirosoma radiotolerans TaxID=1379870 RepID=A0A0E3V6N5_9BACT|nr:non-ribosomal peptide synthetase [Spirosoma radiotolerans]AKD55177.1 amino acid adenylation protein [Spirosoma radiotolerans]
MTESTITTQLLDVDFDPFDGPSIGWLAPATAPQMEIWAACQFGGDDASRGFNESVSLLFTGIVDTPAFEKAWQRLIARHDSLHAAFSADGKQMCVFDDYSVELAYQDYSNRTAADQKRAIDAYAEQDALYVFDLINGPLIKAGLLKLSNTAYHFTLTAHHIICDGWSLGILLQELGALYSAYAQHKSPALAEAPQYSQYASEQLQFVASAEHRAIESFWLDQYKGTVPVVDLPTDFPRPALRQYESARRDYPLKSSLALAVKQLGQKEGASFVTTLITAFEVFLHRLTGQDDLVVGLPTAGQSVTGQVGLIGHCVNLLPLRSFPQTNQRFREFLHIRKEQILDAYEHQQLTFSSLLKKLPIPRDPSRVPMVPIIFNVDMGLDDGVNFYGLDYQLISNPRKYAAVDLFLNISGSSSAQDASLIFEWAYNTHLFKEESIDRMMAEFERLLEEVVANPLVRLGDIQLTSVQEPNKQLAQWNDTKAAYPRQASLHQLLAQTAAQYPDKIALISNGRSLTFRELDETANQVAHAIQQAGVGLKDVIGVVMDRSPELIITLLAILKAGAAYVPIDPDYPHDRIAFMLTDSSANLLLTSKKYLGAGSTYQLDGQSTVQTKVLAIETVLGELDRYAKEAPTTVVTGDDLAYILYTSGSTGQPKGVLIEHHNLVNLLYSMITMPGITKDDALLAVTTISFDIAGLELFLPQLVGATLVLADTETTKDGWALLKAIPQHNITIIQATPATYKLMLLAGWEQRFTLKILCCGEPMSKDLAQKLTARCASLWNMYGPTETTIYSTGKQILASDEIITIGRPIQNTQVYILDEQRKPLPVGAIGEIYLAGDGVARGYLNRPELTKEKFVPDPFASSPNRMMYRTGDLGKFMPDGEIHCLGRIDHQVKIRGYRIELGEIEHALVSHSAIKDAVVMAREDRPGDQRLVAYVVTNRALVNGAFLEQIPAWRTMLRDVLPDYMIPADFVGLQQLPITPNGKIDRKALPRPEAVPVAHETGGEPASAMEKLIYTIWTDVLGVEKISVDHDFFELGGHSMIAVQMMTRLEKETGRRLPLSTLLVYPTVRKLARLLQTEERPMTWKSLVPIKPEGSKTPIYIIHGIGLNLLNFSGLVSYMDAEQPIYGLQALGLDGVDEPLDNMEAIAAHYLTEVIDQNPTGPYAIAGYSFGGYVALEMARQLKAMGKEVKLVAMFDTNAQERDSSQTGLPRLVRKLYRQLPKLVWFTNSLIRHPVMALQYQQQHVKRNVNRFLQAAGFQKPAPVQTETQLDHLALIMEKHEIAFHSYTMKPYDGVIDLFKAKFRIYFVDDNKYLGWKKYALKGVRVHNVPGDHEKMLLPPNDMVFAQTLQRALDNS